MRAEARAGRFGEWLVLGWLWLRGHRLLARNWSTRCGELDIVTWRRGTLYVVEVKTRTRRAPVPPGRAVTKEKRRRILRATRAFLPRARAPCERILFSVAEVWLLPWPRIRFVEDAFRADDVVQEEGR